MRGDVEFRGAPNGWQNFAAKERKVKRHCCSFCLVKVKYEFYIQLPAQAVRQLQSAGPANGVEADSFQ